MTSAELRVVVDRLRAAEAVVNDGLTATRGAFLRAMGTVRQQAPATAGNALATVLDPALDEAREPMMRELIMATEAITGTIQVECDALQALLRAAEDREADAPTLSMRAVASRPAPSVPPVMSVEFDPLTYQFNAFGDSDIEEAGWSGGDGVFSVGMPDGRVVWMFADTMMGHVNGDGSRPRLGWRPGRTRMPNNCLVVQAGDQFATVARPLEEPRTWVDIDAVAPHGGNNVTWTGDGQVHDGLLELLYRRYGQADGFNGLAVARFHPSRFDEMIDLTPIPSGPTAWGSGVLRADDGMTYVYGTEDTRSAKYLRIARTPGSLLDPWEYYASNDEWSPHEHESVRVLEGVANELSVSVVNGRFVLVTHDNSVPMSPDVVAYAAASPAGPFVGKTALFRTPEHGDAGTYGLPQVHSYNAHAHSAIDRGPGALVISYCVNSAATRIVDGEEVFDVEADSSIYRPRFVTVRFDV